MSTSQINSVSGAKQLIQTIVRQRRVRLSDFFKGFDTKCTGKITVAQFVRGFALAGIPPIPEPHISGLAAEYMNSDGFVEYQKFCNDADVSVVKDLEKSPSRALPGLERSSPVHGRGQETTETGSGVNLQDILVKIATYAYDRRVRVIDVLREHDRLRCGLIENGHLRGAFARVGFNLLDKEYALLENVYANGDGRVKWREFAADLETAEPQLRRALGNTQSMGVVQKVSQLVSVRNVLLMPFFRDIDTLRHNRVTVAQFKRCLVQCGISLTDPEYQQLTETYRDGDDVRYDAFMRDVDQQQEAAVQERLDAAALSAKRGYTKVAVEEPPVDIESVLAKVRDLVSKRRMRIAEFVRDYDRLRSGVITYAQLRSGLEAAGVKLSNPEFDVLTNAFRSDKRENSVNWQALSDAVEAVFVTKSLEKSPSLVRTGALRETASPVRPLAIVEDSNTELSRSAAPKVDVNEVLRRLQITVVRRRIRLVEFMRDFDRLRTGLVMRNKFIGALAMAGLNLPVAEIDALCEAYAAPGDADHIRYQQFSEDIESAFTTKGLDKAPTLEVAPLDAREPLPSAETHSEAAVAVLEKLRSVVQTRRIFLKPPMQDYDRGHRGRVTKAQFRAALRSSGLVLPDSEAQMLADAYANDLGDVIYPKFLVDIEM